MASLSLPRPVGRFHDLPLALKSIAGFWVFYLISILARSGLMGDEFGSLFWRRVVGILLGCVLTLLVYVALRLFAARGSLRRMIIIAAIACLPAAFAYSVYTFTVVMMYAPMAQGHIVEKSKEGTVLTRTEREIRIQRHGEAAQVFPVQSIREIILEQAPRQIADATVTWYFFFAAWASFYVAMSSANQLRLAERRASDAERAAQTSQLRALRYQVNPHFLFNTLNSLSSLVMARREEEAERMIMNLSNFFRSTLSIDPAADVTLAEEMALQMLYLDIEKARFPKRLRVEVDISRQLQTARVPALLLQPVVENAIKYGVARARKAVTLTIRAEAVAGGMLRVTVENDGGPVSPDEIGHDGSSTGVGLTNVRQRLAARFGDRAFCTYGPRPEGGFRVELTMPLETDD